MHMEVIMFPEWFTNLPWNIFDVIISFIELLIVCVPATAAFLYYRLQTVAVWTIDKTDNGATLLVHNRTNKTVFITNVSIKPSKRCTMDNPTIAIDQLTKELKPDNYMELVVNYLKKTRKAQRFKIVVEYNRHKKKIIRVKD